MGDRSQTARGSDKEARDKGGRQNDEGRTEHYKKGARAPTHPPVSSGGPRAKNFLGTLEAPPLNSGCMLTGLVSPPEYP